MAVTYDALLRVNAKATGAGEIKSLGNAIGGLTKSAAGLGSIAGSITGLGVALGGAGLAAAGKGIIDMADSLDELSQRTGTSVEMLSRLGLAARQSGLDTEQVSGSMVKLSKNLAAIATGGGDKAAAALTALGISATDSSGNLKTADQVLLEVADRFQGMPDGVMKAKVAMDLFGKSGAALIPMLNMGSDAIEKLNTGMSADFARNAGIYNDQLVNLQAQVSALGASVLSVLLPGLIKVTTWTATAVQNLSGWANENKETIVGLVTGIGAAAKALAPLAIQIVGVIAAWKTYRTAVQLASAAQVLFMRLTPMGAAMLVAGLTAGAFAAAKVAEEMAAIEKKAKESGLAASDFTAAAKDAHGAVDDIVASLSRQANTQEDINKKKAAEVNVQALLKRMHDEAVARVEVQYQHQSRLGSLLAKQVEDRGNMAQQQLSIEEAQIGVARAYLDNRMALARNEQERRAITLEIIELDRKAAAAQHQATLAQIQVERELSNLRTLEAERKFRLALEELRIAEALGTVTAQIKANVESARFGLMSAGVENASVDKALNAREKVAQLNYKAASIGLQGRMATAPQVKPGGLNQWGNIFYVNVPRFAKGGYVTRPTLAEIGEGGEPEYVVPKSKAKSFAYNIIGGVTGNQALKPSWREIALETLASNPNDYMRASNAIMTGWRKQGVSQRASNEQGLRKRALESLGFSLAPGADFGGGDFTLRKRPSMSAIRSELESLRARRSGNTSTGGSSMTINTRVDRVIRQDGEDRITLAQAQALASDAARQAVAQMDGNLRSPTYRQKLGIR